MDAAVPVILSVVGTAWFSTMTIWVSGSISVCVVLCGTNLRDGCRVCFMAREYAAGDNDLRLVGAVVKITEVFTAEHANRTMRRLFFHNCSYANAVVVSYAD